MYIWYAKKSNFESMSKLITVSENLFKDVLPHVKNTSLESKVKNLMENTGKYQTQNIS